jgi:hypothetical protein
MALQNRVDPWGKILSTSARGTLMGNRGVLIDESRQIVRNYQVERWITCRLSFKDRRRQVMTPGTYTELFFLDEATAFAAGHRPCAECQRPRFTEFKQAWLAANPIFGFRDPRIEEIDEVLHRERLQDGEKRTYRAPRTGLPDGTFFAVTGDAYLAWAGEAFRWSFTGYTRADTTALPVEVDVLTPYSIVKTFEAGFRPYVHPTAQI